MGLDAGDRRSNRRAAPLVVVRHRRYDMVSRWQARFANGLGRYADLETLNLIGPWSSARLRFCTSDMKSAVITAELIRRFAGERFISVVGLRRAESPGRRATPISVEDPRYRRRNGTSGITWHPGVNWTTDHVFALHAQHDLPLHEAYETWGASRLSCRFCILASLGDLRAGSSAPSNHDAYRELVALEARSSFSFQPTRWLGDVAPHLLTGEVASALARGKRNASERRAIEAALPTDLRYVAGWPPRVPDHDEARQLVDARRRIGAHHDLALRHVTATAVIDRFAELMALQRTRRASKAVRRPVGSALAPR